MASGCINGIDDSIIFDRLQFSDHKNDRIIEIINEIERIYELSGITCFKYIQSSLDQHVNGTIWRVVTRASYILMHWNWSDQLPSDTVFKGQPLLAAIVYTSKMCCVTNLRNRFCMQNVLNLFSRIVFATACSCLSHYCYDKEGRHYLNIYGVKAWKYLQLVNTRQNFQRKVIFETQY